MRGDVENPSSGAEGPFTWSLAIPASEMWGEVSESTRRHFLSPSPPFHFICRAQEGGTFHICNGCLSIEPCTVQVQQ